MKNYDYAKREGVEDISWERFFQLSQMLAELLAADGVEAVVGTARAGLFPAAQVAAMLRLMLYPASVSRRVNDLVTFERPVWRVDICDEVRGKRVAVVDEIADSGETLALVKQRVLEKGASGAVSAALITHSWASPHPDRVALVTDALVVFPWDAAVYQGGRWQPNPELEAALNLQKKNREG